MRVRCRLSSAEQKASDNAAKMMLLRLSYGTLTCDVSGGCFPFHITNLGKGRGLLSISASPLLWRIH